MKFLIILMNLLIIIAWILAEMEVKAERRTFDFFKKHHHKHRKEDHSDNYLLDSDFYGYHDSGLNNGGHYYPSVHVHAYGVNGYGIGGLGFHGGAIHSSNIHGINFHHDGGNLHGGYFGGNHFGSGHFGDGLEHNVLGIQDEGVHGEFGEDHEYVGSHGSHLTHFG